MKKLVLTTVVLMQAILMVDCLLARRMWQTGLSAVVVIWLLYLLFDLLFVRKAKKEHGGKDKSKDRPKGVLPISEVSPKKPTAKPGRETDTPPHDGAISYFEKYIENIKGKHGEKAANDLRLDVEALLGGKDEDGNPCEGRINEILDDEQNYNRAKGLVVGRVQSGKTQNYAGVILKAIDEGYNAFIVLTSNLTNLAQQTYDRFLGDEGCFKAVKLSSDKYVINDFLNGEGSSQYSIIDEGKFFIGFAQKEQLRNGGHLPRVIRWLRKAGEYANGLRVLIIDDEADVAQNSKSGVKAFSISDIFRMCSVAEEWDPRGKHLAEWIRDIVTLPNTVADDAGRNHMDKLCEMIEDSKNNELFTNLIEQFQDIDAARRCEELRVFYDLLNLTGRWSISDPITGRRSNFDPIETIKDFFNADPQTTTTYRPSDFVRLFKYIFAERDRSVINKSIVEIFNCQCERMVYLGYTATPFANLGNETPAENPLYPQFVQSLRVSPAYFGFAQMFSAGQDVNALAQVRIVSEDEHNQRIARAEYKISDWVSMKNALSWAFCTAACRMILMEEKRINPRQGKTTTMFVNIHRETGPHRKQKKAIDNWLKAIRESDDKWCEFKNSCGELWESEVDRFNLDVFNQQNNDFPFETVNGGKGIRNWTNDDWRSIEKKLDHFRAAHVNVIVLNSDGQNSGDADKYEARDTIADSTLWIICGGNSISRGLTLDGLTTSYYDRVTDTTCVDTMSQMGRWFGFRSGYELLPRIWMPKKAVQRMQEAGECENKLHKELKEGFAAGCDTSDPNYYQPLYSCVQQLTGRDAALSRKGMFRVCDVAVSLSTCIDNINGAWELLETNVNQNFGGEKFDRDNAYPYASHPYWKNVSALSINQFLSDAARFVPADTQAILNGLGNYAKQNEEVRWDVVIADVASGETCNIGNMRIGISCADGEKVDQGDIVRYTRKTMDYLSYLAHYTEEQLVLVDRACANKYGKQLRRGARSEYRDMAYTLLRDENPKLQIFLVKSPIPGTPPLVKYAFEWPGKRSTKFQEWIPYRLETHGINNNHAHKEDAAPQPRSGRQENRVQSRQGQEDQERCENNIDKARQKIVNFLRDHQDYGPAKANKLWNESGCKKEYPGLDQFGKDVLPWYYNENDEKQQRLVELGVRCSNEKQNGNGRALFSWNNEMT